MKKIWQAQFYFQLQGEIGPQGFHGGTGLPGPQVR